ncbi:unnamed protein product [Amoebophrya sp. A120]|nr:unnamed protein product [Amoebophrya sp. A120]|eukprot:GSA120T00002782001.1
MLPLVDEAEDGTRSEDAVATVALLPSTTDHEKTSLERTTSTSELYLQEKSHVKLRIRAEQAGVLLRAMSALDLLAGNAGREDDTPENEKRRRFQALADFLVRKCTLGERDFVERTKEAQVLAEAVLDLPEKIQERSSEFLRAQVPAVEEGGEEDGPVEVGRPLLEESARRPQQHILSEVNHGDAVPAAEENNGRDAVAKMLETAEETFEQLDVKDVETSEAGQVCPLVQPNDLISPLSNAFEAMLATAKAQKTRTERIRGGGVVYDFAKILADLPVSDIFRMLQTGTTSAVRSPDLVSESESNPTGCIELGFWFLPKDNVLVDQTGGESSGATSSLYELEYCHSAAGVGIMFVSEGQFVERESGGLALFLPSRLRARFWKSRLRHLLLLRRDQVEEALARWEEQAVAERNGTAGRGFFARWSTDFAQVSLQREALTEMAEQDASTSTILDLGFDTSSCFTSDHRDLDRREPEGVVSSATGFHYSAQLSSRLVHEMTHELQQLGIRIINIDQACAVIDIDNVNQTLSA